MQLAPRPTYDIVEEYVKSLDEFRTLKHPKPHHVADIVLRIADFFMEFAICGHETMADVPNLIHPPIPPEDLRALGVPHLYTDEEGKTSFIYPRCVPFILTREGARTDPSFTHAIMRLLGHL